MRYCFSSEAFSSLICVGVICCSSFPRKEVFYLYVLKYPTFTKRSTRRNKCSYLRSKFAECGKRVTHIFIKQRALYATHKFYYFVRLYIARGKSHPHRFCFFVNNFCCFCLLYKRIKCVASTYVNVSVCLTHFSSSLNHRKTKIINQISESDQRVVNVFS